MAVPLVRGFRPEMTSCSQLLERPRAKDSPRCGTPAVAADAKAEASWKPNWSIDSRPVLVSVDRSPL